MRSIVFNAWAVVAASALAGGGAMMANLATNPHLWTSAQAIVAYCILGLGLCVSTSLFLVAWQTRVVRQIKLFCVEADEIAAGKLSGRELADAYSDWQERVRAYLLAVFLDVIAARVYHASAAYDGDSEDERLRLFLGAQSRALSRVLDDYKKWLRPGGQP